MNAAALAEEADRLADNAGRLRISNSNPHAFHEDISELRNDLRALATWLRTGQKPVER